jgi:hypothetical protein
LLSGVWISVALAFNVFIYLAYEHRWFGLDLPEHELDGRTAAVLFLTGYVVEKSLGLDNVIAIAMIFTYFHIPPLYQHRVLFWGVVGAIVMRALMIFAGVAFDQRFDWILYLFGAFLIVSGVKMALARHTPDLEKNRASANIRRSRPWTPWCGAQSGRQKIRCPIQPSSTIGSAVQAPKTMSSSTVNQDRSRAHARSKQSTIGPTRCMDRSVHLARLRS